MSFCDGPDSLALFPWAPGLSSLACFCNCVFSCWVLAMTPHFNCSALGLEVVISWAYFSGWWLWSANNKWIFSFINYAFILFFLRRVQGSIYGSFLSCTTLLAAALWGRTVKETVWFKIVKWTLWLQCEPYRSPPSPGALTTAPPLPLILILAFMAHGPGNHYDRQESCEYDQWEKQVVM